MRALLFAAASLAACAPPPAPPSPPAAPPPAPRQVAGPEWEPLRDLLGTWVGSDTARGTSGRFTLEPELDGHVLVRHNEDRTPQGRHEDLMIIFRTPSGLRASYFDNEGHAIAYTVTATGPHVELLSDDVPGMPRFQLVYDVKGPDELAIDFAIARPGTTELVHYTGGTVHRAR